MPEEDPNDPIPFWSTERKQAESFGQFILACEYLHLYGLKADAVKWVAGI
jgi:hypothetical protein